MVDRSNPIDNPFYYHKDMYNGTLLVKNASCKFIHSIEILELSVQHVYNSFFFFLTGHALL